MKTAKELEVTVKEDGTLKLARPLPKNFNGRIVVLLISEDSNSTSEIDSLPNTKPYLQYENGVLVYTGEVPEGNPVDWINQARNERFNDLVQRSSQ